MMRLLNDRDPSIPLSHACHVLDVPRANVYRDRSEPVVRCSRPRVASHRRIPDDERKAVLDLLHSERFLDQPPAEVHAALLSEGKYVCSIRTMHRILEESAQNGERRAQRLPHAHARPSLRATAPNQVWTWDISKLAGPEPGIFYSLYVILDLFSRYPVGWMVAAHENTALAKQLFAETIARHAIGEGQLTAHMDRGAPMTSHGFAQLLATLGVSRSFSRPRVSDDNAFSEACFKTLKYQSDYPGRFENLEHARAWLADFFDWYGREHHHHGLALFTPEDVFLGRVNEIAVVRQTALDDAFKAHPERFPNGRPTVRLPNAVVAINPVPPVHDDGKDVVLETLASQTSSEAAAASPSTERQLAPPSKAKPKITRSAFVAALAT
jgi:putative transposase